MTASYPPVLQRAHTTGSQPRSHYPVRPGILKSEGGSDTPKRRHPVSFDITEVREYPIILDGSRRDEPVMLTLGWQYKSADVTTVQEYDLVKLDNRERTGGVVRRLGPSERAAILISAGFSIKDLGRHLLKGGHVELDQNTEDARKTVHPEKKKALFSMRKDPAKAAMQ